MVFYNRKEDYLTILNSYHQEFMNRFNRTQNGVKAQRLEQILREIKQFNIKEIDPLNDDDLIEGSIKKGYYDLLTNATSFLQDVRHHKGIKGSSFLRRAHSKYGMTKFNNADDIFEQELASIIAATEFMATGKQDISADIHLFGANKQSSTAVNQVLDKNFDGTIIEVINKLAEKVGSKYSAKKLEIEKGKIDVNGIGANVVITKRIPPVIEELFTLFQGHTFSLKNYSSYRKNKSLNKMEYKDLADLDIHFGNTNLFKAITGSLAELGISGDDQIAFFFRGGNHIQGRGPRYSKELYPEDTQQHWSHMRLIYELRGSGLLDSNGNLSMVDFIIWNDPSTENIAVDATDVLIYNILNNTTRKSLFNEIKLSANQL